MDIVATVALCLVGASALGLAALAVRRKAPTKPASPVSAPGPQPTAEPTPPVLVSAPVTPAEPTAPVAPIQRTAAETPPELRASTRPSPSTGPSSKPAAKLKKPSAPRPHPPQVGPYKIDTLIGEGAMASVYRAEHVETGQVVAVKLVLPGLQNDPEFQKRFARELEISRSLTHPNIVKVFEAGEEGGQLYMAMELVDGQNLDELLGGKPLPLTQVARIAGQLVDGLHYAHQRDMIHRDIKPSNVMVTRNGIPKLLDFGLALQEGMSRLTSVGAAMGTPTHMAPEVFTTGNSDKKSDQYSLGVVIYQMLTGRCPFEGPDAMAIAMQHVKSPPPTIRSLNEEVPLRLEQIVMRMLKKKPDERYPTLTQLQMEMMSAV